MPRSNIFHLKTNLLRCSFFNEWASSGAVLEAADVTLNVEYQKTLSIFKHAASRRNQPMKSSVTKEIRYVVTSPDGCVMLIGFPNLDGD